jgi:hypothetical protein
LSGIASADIHFREQFFSYQRLLTCLQHFTDYARSVANTLFCRAKVGSDSGSIKTITLRADDETYISVIFAPSSARTFYLRSGWMCLDWGESRRESRRQL